MITSFHAVILGKQHFKIQATVCPFLYVYNVINRFVNKPRSGIS